MGEQHCCLCGQQDTKDIIGNPWTMTRTILSIVLLSVVIVCLSENDKRNAEVGSRHRRAVNIGMDAEQRRMRGLLAGAGAPMSWHVLQHLPTIQHLARHPCYSWTPQPGTIYPTHWCHHTMPALTMKIFLSWAAPVIVHHCHVSWSVENILLQVAWVGLR